MRFLKQSQPRRKFAMNSEIETPRLLLRHWTPNDVAEMCDIYADSETMRLFGVGTTFSPAQVADSLVNVIAEYADCGLGNYAVIEKHNAKIIGHCGLHRGHESDIEIEVDCLIARERWGLGYGTEAAIVVMRQAFLHEHIAVISGVAHHENHASIALMQKLGMSYVGKRVRFGFDSVLYQVRAGPFWDKLAQLDPYVTEH
jgi:[ribosomal protein S5]-alanine N-acetyltransferase